MKIRLAILETDTIYLQRIVSVFNNKYADKLEVYSFTEKDMALETAHNAKINVFLAGEEYDITPELLPERCAFAYFVDTPDVQIIHQCPAVCKFQKIDMLYKQILSLYSEVAADIITTVSGEEGSCRVISFLSPAGGVGSSTVAAACAMALVKKGKRVLYLNLEKYGSTKAFFQGMGQESLSDVLYNIKSQKANLALKLEGIIKQDESGVCFLAECDVVLDRLEMKKEELDILLNQIKISENYDYVILDMDFSFDDFELEAMKQSNVAVLVSNGTENANSKVERVYKSMEILEQQQKGVATSKFMILYNHFHAETGQRVENIEIAELGGIQSYKGADAALIAKEISKMTIFEKLM